MDGKRRFIFKDEVMSLSERRNFRLKFIFEEGSSEYVPFSYPTSDEGRPSPPSKRRRTDEESAVEQPADEKVDEDIRQWWPNVRQKFFLYTPATVCKIDNIDVLHRVQDLYRPSAQPHSAEEFEYLDLVAKAADARLQELKCSCHSCGLVWGE